MLLRTHPKSYYLVPLSSTTPPGTTYYPLPTTHLLKTYHPQPNSPHLTTHHLPHPRESAHDDEMGTRLLRRKYSLLGLFKDQSGCGRDASEQRTNMSHRLGRQEVAVLDLLLLPHDCVTSTCHAAPRAVSNRSCTHNAQHRSRAGGRQA